MNGNTHDGIHNQQSSEGIPPHIASGANFPGQIDNSRFGFLPLALRGRIPEIWLLLLEKSNRIVVETTLFLLAAFALFATLIGPPHRAEWVSLITAALAPLGFAIWYALFPLNPYKTRSFIKQGMQNLDHSDPAANELVLTLSSSEASRTVWLRTQILWIIFFLPMAIIALASHGLPPWEANLSWIIRVPFFCLLLFALYRIEMLSWALRVIKRSQPK